jgi:hypothetical protein
VDRCFQLGRWTGAGVGSFGGLASFAAKSSAYRRMRVACGARTCYRFSVASIASLLSGRRSTRLGAGIRNAAPQHCLRKVLLAIYRIMRVHEITRTCTENNAATSSKIK